MTKLIATLLVIISTHAGLAQSKSRDYEPIDKLGWKMINFSEPENLTDTDIGAVKYLLRLNRKGVVRRISVLTNTFSSASESKWRNEVKKILFIQDAASGKIAYKGTLLIERERCSKIALDLPSN